MIDVTGNLWDYEADVRVVTTNGYVRKDGAAVMGRGCALEARERFPGLAERLGKLLAAEGNVCHYFPDIRLVTFPVKPVFGPGGEPGWRAKADLGLIARSAIDLEGMTERYGWKTVVMPRPGVGFGHLAYSDVREVISPILDDRFHVITFPPREGQ